MNLQYSDICGRHEQIKRAFKKNKDQLNTESSC
jgi:hypothetical protein